MVIQDRPIYQSDLENSSSTAFSHGFEFEKLLTLKEFDVITRNDIDRLVKQLSYCQMMVTRMRNRKVIKVATHHFLKHDSDDLFLAF